MVDRSISGGLVAVHTDRANVLGMLSGATPGVIAATGDYAANDVVSNAVTDGQGVAWVFDNVVRGNGLGGWILGAVLTCSVDAMVPRLRLWLFNDTPASSELDDNSAFSLAAADRVKIVGYIDFNALGDAGAISVSVRDDLRLPFKCAASGAALYGVLQTLDAFTNESAGMTVTISLHAVSD